MNRKLTLIALIVIATAGLLNSGCAYIDRSTLKPAAEASRVPPLFRTAECRGFKAPDPTASWINITESNNFFVKNICEDQIESLESESDPSVTSNCPTINVTGGNIDQAKVQLGVQLRECAALLERKSDAICTAHLSRIFGNRAVTNVTLGTLTAATGIAGGLVTGGAANALSGTAGFLTAGRSLFNEEVYRSYVAEAVIKVIIKNRKDLQDAIADGIANGDAGPNKDRIDGVQQVIRRVSEYHNACSFYAGLTALVSDAGQDRYAVNLQDGLDGQIAFLDSQIKIVTTEYTTAELANKADAAKSLKTRLDSLTQMHDQLGLQKSFLGRATVATKSPTESPNSPAQKRPTPGASSAAGSPAPPASAAAGGSSP